MTSGLLAEFASPDSMLDAARRLHDSGYEEIDTFSPSEVDGVDRALGRPRSKLAWVVFVAGLCGAFLGYWIQYSANAVWYPLNVGGRPPHSAPAFILITFEGAVLLGSVFGFIALLYTLGLPRPWHPVFEIDGFERASIDRYWVGIDARDPRFDPAGCHAALEALHPLRIVRLEERG